MNDIIDTDGFSDSTLKNWIWPDLTSVLQLGHNIRSNQLSIYF